MPTQYILEVRPSGSDEKVWMIWRSHSPFMAISPGDFINPLDWPEKETPAKILRVVEVEHEISGRLNEPRHVVTVYAEKTDRTPHKYQRDQYQRINPSPPLADPEARARMFERWQNHRLR